MSQIEIEKKAHIERYGIYWQAEQT